MNIKRIITGYLNENCYVLTIDNECLIVDPGDNYEKIKNEIGKNKVLGILLTHNHFDHVGAVSDIKSEYNCKVYSYENLKEGENIISNFKFNVIYTTGHTSDSITFYFKEDKIMFTGDFLFKGTVGRWDLPTGNIKEMHTSINKIKTYPKDTIIYPGHGESTILSYELDNNEYLFTN